MEVMKAIAARRSIRRFEDSPIPQEILERILLAGTLALPERTNNPGDFMSSEAKKGRK